MTKRLRECHNTNISMADDWEEYMDYYECLSSNMMYDIAETQADIFRYAYDNNYAMSTFIKNYMYSDFCNNEMDSDCSFFHFKPGEVCAPYVLSEKDCPKTEEQEYMDFRFIAMVYRYLVFYTGKASKEVYELISPEELDDLSISYEEYVIEDAAKEIMKSLLRK